MNIKDVKDKHDEQFTRLAFLFLLNREPRSDEISKFQATLRQRTDLNSFFEEISSDYHCSDINLPKSDRNILEIPPSSCEQNISSRAREIYVDLVKKIF